MLKYLHTKYENRYKEQQQYDQVDNSCPNTIAAVMTIPYVILDKCNYEQHQQYEDRQKVEPLFATDDSHDLEELNTILKYTTKGFITMLYCRFRSVLSKNSFEKCLCQAL